MSVTTDLFVLSKLEMCVYPIDLCVCVWIGLFPTHGRHKHAHRNILLLLHAAHTFITNWFRSADITCGTPSAHKPPPPPVAGTWEISRAVAKTNIAAADVAAAALRWEWQIVRSLGLPPCSMAWDTNYPECWQFWATVYLCVQVVTQYTHLDVVILSRNIHWRLLAISVTNEPVTTLGH